jgi:hypothetical protein
MRVTMLLADAAHVADGKLYILGGGWSVTGPPGPSAVAIYVEVPWDMTNRQLEWSLELVDSDGYPVLAGGPEGNGQPIGVKAAFEVGRPPGTPHGASIGFPLALNFPPLPLQPAKRYEWRFTIAGESREDWRLAFTTRPGNWSA